MMALEPGREVRLRHFGYPAHEGETSSMQQDTALRRGSRRQRISDSPRSRLNDRHWLAIGALVFFVELIAAVAILGLVL